MTDKVLIVLTVVLAGALAQFNPTMTIDSCTKSTLEITLSGAGSEGLVYIQGQNSACRQNTDELNPSHTFSFGHCGIEWEESFKIVIQKKSLYMTGDDKQIPVMCVADLSDLTVSNNLNISDKNDDAGQNKTVKPSAFMKLYKDGGDISGQVVQLGDSIDMILQLEDEYIQDFDIKARYCTADNIDIVVDYCSADTDLVTHVSRTTQGVLQTSFGAFRTTSLYSGAVYMPFTCTLQVCLGLCPQTDCSDGLSSYGRKKRDIEKRQAEDSGVEDISVGATLSITTEEVVIEAPEDSGEMCMNQAMVVAIIIILVGGLVVCTAAAVYMFRKMQEKAGILRKLSNGAPMDTIIST